MRKRHMSTQVTVTGFKPPGEEWRKMRAVYDVCMQANVPVPEEVLRFLERNPLSEDGVPVSEDDLRQAGAVKDVYHTDIGVITALDIDPTKIPKDITFLRVSISP